MTDEDEALMVEEAMVLVNLRPMLRQRRQSAHEMMDTHVRARKQYMMMSALTMSEC